MQALYDRGVIFWDAVAERFGAIGGGDSRGVQQIFSAPGNAVKRATIFSGGDFSVACLACAMAKSLVSVMTQRSFGLNCSRRFK